MSETVYHNGELIPVAEARIAVTDYGLMFGYGLFETMRAYRGKVFCLEEHIHRLKRSAEQLGIEVAGETLQKAVADTIKANNLSEARVRLMVTGGEGPLTPDLQKRGQPNVIVRAQEYHPFSEETYEKGWRVMVATTRRNNRSAISGMKSANYLENLLVKEEARRREKDDAVMLNNDGLVAEATSSNIFAVYGGKLKTPRWEAGILPGITRAQVIKIAGALKIDCRETDIDLEELTAADEVFLSNAIVELMTVSEIEGQKIGEGRRGELTRKLSEEYRARVRAAVA